MFVDGFFLALSLTCGRQLAPENEPNPATGDLPATLHRRSSTGHRPQISSHAISFEATQNAKDRRPSESGSLRRAGNVSELETKVQASAQGFFTRIASPRAMGACARVGQG